MATSVALHLFLSQMDLASMKSIWELGLTVNPCSTVNRHLRFLVAFDFVIVRQLHLQTC